MESSFSTGCGRMGTMKWKKFRIETIAEAEDIIISALYDIGLEGAQIEDSVPLTESEKAQMFVDIMPQEPWDDGLAYLSFFVEETESGRLLLNGEETDISVILERVREVLDGLREFMEIGRGSVSVEETEDVDWINNWKKYFHQFYIDDLLVIPSWEEMKAEDTGRKVLHIDPGTAFGTGMHETTQLCIRQLWKYITPQTRLLDVGTGSGILSIVSLLYGIREACGTDLDVCAVDAVRQNMEANGIPAQKWKLLIGNILTQQDIRDALGYGCYDIVVANILADVLIPLSPVVMPHLKKGGIYIVSGIIDEKEEAVATAVEEAGFTLLERTYQGEWVGLTARKD